MTPPTTSPQAWSAAVARHAVAPMVVEGGRLVVVAAHPDDETLGTGGFLQAARAAGAHIELVVATDGEAAFGAPDDELRRTRWRELRAALGELGLGDVPVHRLGLPDSGLAGCHDELVAALTPLLAGAHTALAPWTGDPHPDHAAAGHAVLAAATAATHRWTYPIWTLPWSTPEEQADPVAARRGVHARRVRRGRQAPRGRPVHLADRRPRAHPGRRGARPLRQRAGAVLPGPAHRLRPGQPVRGPVRRRR